jgi:hypothetical protein
MIESEIIEILKKAKTNKNELIFLLNDPYD